MSMREHLKKMETLRNRVSDNQNSCVGRTVEGMTVRHRCLSEDT